VYLGLDLRDRILSCKNAISDCVEFAKDACGCRYAPEFSAYARSLGVRLRLLPDYHGLLHVFYP